MPSALGTPAFVVTASFRLPFKKVVFNQVASRPILVYHDVYIRDSGKASPNY